MTAEITPEKIQEIIVAFIAEDKRLADLPETEETGHPFTICTNCARWVQKNYFPEGRIVGYFSKEFTGGHDFLLIDHRYIIDLWPRFTDGEEHAPVFYDLKEDFETITRLYGSILKWEEVK